MRLRLLAIAGIILFFLIYTVPPGAAEELVQSAPLVLFGIQSTNVHSLDRVMPTRALRSWRTVLYRHEKNNAFAFGNYSMSNLVRKQWETLAARFPSMSPVQQLQAINAFFNHLPGESARIGYGKEYWAYPAKFLSRYRGDCKAYAAAKFLALRHLDWPEDKLWLVSVYNLPRKEAHAVVAAQWDGQVFILDNLSRPKDLIVPHEKQASIYHPMKAFNERTVWVFPSGPYGKRP